MGEHGSLTTGGGRGRPRGTVGFRQLWVTAWVKATGRARRPLVGPGSRRHRLTRAVGLPIGGNTYALRKRLGENARSGKRQGDPGIRAPLPRRARQPHAVSQIPTACPISPSRPLL